MPFRIDVFWLERYATFAMILWGFSPMYCALLFDIAYGYQVELVRVHRKWKDSGFWIAVGLIATLAMSASALILLMARYFEPDMEQFMPIVLILPLIAYAAGVVWAGVFTRVGGSGLAAVVRLLIGVLLAVNVFLDFMLLRLTGIWILYGIALVALGLGVGLWSGIGALRVRQKARTEAQSAATGDSGGER